MTRLKLSHETGMGLRGHPVAQAYERLAAAIFETAYLSAARIGRRPFTSAEPMKIASFRNRPRFPFGHHYLYLGG